MADICQGCQNPTVGGACFNKWCGHYRDLDRPTFDEFLSGLGRRLQRRRRRS